MPLFIWYGFSLSISMWNRFEYSKSISKTVQIFFSIFLSIRIFFFFLDFMLPTHKCYFFYCVKLLLREVSNTIIRSIKNVTIFVSGLVHMVKPVSWDHFRARYLSWWRHNSERPATTTYFLSTRQSKKTLYQRNILLHKSLMLWLGFSCIRIKKYQGWSSFL